MQKRKVILGIAVLVVAVVVLGVLQFLGLVPVSFRSEVQGEFKITHFIYGSLSHSSGEVSGITIHRRRALWDRHVASSVANFLIHEKEPSRLFYELCPGREYLHPECGTYYYDARLDRSVKIASYMLPINSLKEPGAWSLNSPYGSYAALAAEEGAVIVDLATGTAMDVGQMLVLEPRRQMQFGPWSPDGKCIVALVTNYLDQSPPYIHTEQDLFLIYPKLRNVEYIASAVPGWRPEGYEWHSSGRLWVLSTSRFRGPTDEAAGIRRKGEDELPHLNRLASLAPGGCLP